jgi:hypothetical protein
MGNREAIDSKKIYALAAEFAKDGKTWHTKADEKTKDLSVEEFVMLIGFTYIELMVGSGLLPKTLKKEMLNKINTQLQRLATELKQYREFYKLHIQFLKASEQVRVDLIKAINSFDDEKALQQALLLADMSESHIAGSHTFTTRYTERSRNDTVDSGAAE